MKKTKIIIPALGMLLLSTAASVTGTVAWFSMNNFVNATNMNIQAKAENGIVIAATEDSVTWSDTASSSLNNALAVYPTSTENATTWAHSVSNSMYSADSNGQYSMLSDDNDWGYDASTGAGYLNKNGVDGYSDAEGTGTYAGLYDEAYYLMQSFYVKSSAETITKNIYVTKVTVTGSSSSANLNKALRVLVKHSTTSLVFAPFSGATASYPVCVAVTPDDPATQANEYVATMSTNNVSAIDASSNPVNQLFLSNQAIPPYSANSESNPRPLKFDIYLYFEGEDANCKSEYITATLDSLQVSVEFGTTTR